MKRRIRIAAASLMAAAGLITALGTPASAAAPPGQGLVQFGPWQCEGLGEVDLFGPRGFKAATVFTSPTGQHLSLLSLELTGTEFDGTPIDFSKTYGEKSGLTTFTCTQHFEGEDPEIVDATAVVGLVPPQ
jgi:hypothetical protein